MEDIENQTEGEKEEEKTVSRVGKTNPLLIPGAIIAAGALIAGAVVYSNSAGIGARTRGTTAAVSLGQKIATGNIQDDDPALGNPNAPVTIVEFSDFQCPYCEKFFQGTERQIIEKYVKTGKVRFVYRDFPLSSRHPMAQKAAEAGECAHEQDKFWEYHNMIFKNQPDLNADNLKKWARDLGLDAGKFNACLDGSKYAGEVQKDLDDGVALGVTGTPTNFINGKFIEGAVPFNQIEPLIESALKGE